MTSTVEMLRTAHERFPHISAIAPADAIRPGEWLLHHDLIQCPACQQSMIRTILYVPLHDDDVLVLAMTLWPDATVQDSASYLSREGRQHG